VKRVATTSYPEMWISLLMSRGLHRDNLINYLPTLVEKGEPGRAIGQYFQRQTLPASRIFKDHRCGSGLVAADPDALVRFTCFWTVTHRQARESVFAIIDASELDNLLGLILVESTIWPAAFLRPPKMRPPFSEPSSL